MVALSILHFLFHFFNLLQSKREIIVQLKCKGIIGNRLIIVLQMRGRIMVALSSGLAI